MTKQSNIQIEIIYNVNALPLTFKSAKQILANYKKPQK